MKGLMKLIWVEFKLYMRQPQAAFFTLVFPLLLLFMFGSIYGNKPTPFFGGHGMVDVSTPAYIAIILGSTGFMSMSIIVSTYRERGILRRFRATPLRPMAIIGAQVTGIRPTTPNGLGKGTTNVTQGRACMNCHTEVHGSNNPSATNPTPQFMLR